MRTAILKLVSRKPYHSAMPTRTDTPQPIALAPPPSTARATIADVARVAGVSKATVSRVLNRRTDLLTPDIAARVDAAISALAYVPSPMAQGLKRGRSRLIGLVVADITNPYSVAVLRGAEKACQQAGYLVMLFNLSNESGREREAIEALSSYQVDGFILNTLGGEARAVAEATRHGKPVVLVDRRHPGMQADFVSLDNAGAVRLGVEHLVDTGHQQLLYVTEPVAGVSSREERTSAFHSCVAAHDPQVTGHTFESTTDNPQALDVALQTLPAQTTSTPRPAVLCGNAVITLRVAAAVARLGWQLGRDVALIGFDETEWAPLVGPGLSTLAQPTDDLGRLAAQCLLERLQGLVMAPRQILLPAELVVRGSTRAAG